MISNNINLTVENWLVLITCLFFISQKLKLKIN